MTLDQLIAWNGNIPFAEYEALLQKMESKEKALRRARETGYSEEISLDALRDERGSERWQRHEKRHQGAAKRCEKLEKEIIDLKTKLL